MFTQLIVLAVCVTAIYSCDRGSQKYYNDACECGDQCMSNSYCLYQDNVMKCSCLPCQYWDPDMKQCIDRPGKGQYCNGVCASNLKCIGNYRNASTCECLATEYYNAVTKKCVGIPGIGDQCRAGMCQSNLVCDQGICKCRTYSKYDQKQGRCVYSGHCLGNHIDGCVGVPDGDYPLCQPECQQGRFATCSNQLFYLRDCALGFYVYNDGARFTARLVFDPVTARCERWSYSCPRPLDAYAEE